MKIKGVIFDLDGTLLNTLDDISDAMNYALQKNGFLPHKIDDYKYFVGSGVDVLVERVLTKYQATKEQKGQIKKDYIIKYEEVQKNKTRPYDGIRELIDYLKFKNVKLAVLSNKPHPDTLSVVDHYFNLKTFDIVFGQRKGVETKPNPIGVFDILDTLKIKEEEVLYVGDTDVDMKTAHAAGVVGVGALWGFRTAEELINANAQILISDPKDLIVHIK